MSTERGESPPDCLYNRTVRNMTDSRAALTGSDTVEVPALGQSRARVLATLQSADGPLGVGEVAAKVRLHLNTARFHLDGLVEQGLAERITEEREIPGRPRALYSPCRTVAPAGRRSYQLLAHILTSSLARGRYRERAALKAGQEWGRHLAARPASTRRVTAASATPQPVPRNRHRTPRGGLHRPPGAHARCPRRTRRAAGRRTSRTVRRAPFVHYAPGAPATTRELTEGPEPDLPSGTPRVRTGLSRATRPTMCRVARTPMSVP
jgi:hypothetical protein